MGILMQPEMGEKEKYIFRLVNGFSVTRNIDSASYRHVLIFPENQRSLVRLTYLIIFKLK